MLFLLSPAKTLDYDTPVPAALAKKATDPLFTERAGELIDTLKTRTPAEVASLMELSDALATLNVGRYVAWQRAGTPDNSKPAVLAFNGDVYEGLDANTLKPADLAWAQDHVVILSGLYGALRPLDLIQPHRLEMGTRLRTARGATLYAWWGDRIARELNRRLDALSGERILLNLASGEYFKSVDRKVLDARVVECVFQDEKHGAWKVISFHAKRARGLMARHVIDHRIDAVAGLRDFSSEGYAYAPRESTADRLVFRRSSQG